MDRDFIHKAIATSGGVGFLPGAPGTYGAVVGFLICLIFYFGKIEFFPFQVALFIMAIISYWLGVWSSNKLIPSWGADPKQIVIDETCGYFISMFFLPPNLFNLVGAFILFRIFDIWKPFGIRKLELLKDKAHAIMLDDVFAGFLSIIVLHIIVLIKNQFI